MSIYARLVLAAVLALALAGVVWKVNHWDNARLEAATERGREEIRTDWRKQLIADQRTKEEEGARRLKDQQENQRVQNQEIAAARAAADRNARDADRVREQSADAARQWSARLADSPTRADLEAAASAIRVCTDLRGRADRRAGILASYADTARAHGLKCERDYDTLSRVRP